MQLHINDAGAFSLHIRIDYNFVIKVADFGLSESIDTAKQYFRQDKEVVVKLPIKWLAPESINESVFSEKTDVVSKCNCDTVTILGCTSII